MQKLDIQCDMCDTKFSLLFSADVSDPIICPFCADYLDGELQGNDALLKDDISAVADLPSEDGSVPPEGDK